MAIQVQGNGGTVAEVDGSTFRAIRVTGRPIDYGALGFYRLAMVSGTMAAALAANAELFQHRWTDATRFACTYRVAISAGANVAATAAALIAFRLAIARSWTGIGTGGTRATLTGNNQKLRTSMGTSLVNDAGISTTGGLTAGTKTIDSQDIAAVAQGIGTGAITTALALQILPATEMLNVDASTDHPIVAAQNEGWILRSGPANPAAMTWHFAVSCSWAEVSAF